MKLTSVSLTVMLLFLVGCGSSSSQNTPNNPEPTNPGGNNRHTGPRDT
jgi:uncharacterized protein YcfL